MAENDLRSYLEKLYGSEDDYLRKIRLGAQDAGLPAIQVPIELGRHLQFLVKAHGVHRILEMGTLFGYSSILMARALPADGELITLEVSPRHAAIARENIRGAQLKARVEVREGPALESLEALQGEAFDLIFIDADKETYPSYLEQALKLSHRGTVIVADNVWRRGAVTDESTPDGRAMTEFNRAILTNSRLISTIVPRADGTDAASISAVLYD